MKPVKLKPSKHFVFTVLYFCKKITGYLITYKKKVAFEVSVKNNELVSKIMVCFRNLLLNVIINLWLR